MKNIKQIVTILFIVINIFKVASQESNDVKKVILTENDNKYILTRSATVTNNLNSAVIINQVGNYNSNQIDFITNQSIINVSQNGNLNNVTIFRDENFVNEFIFQNGNENSINEMSLGNYNTINTELIQNGENNRITSFGSNSISQSMRIQINGNNSSIVIISR